MKAEKTRYLFNELTALFAGFNTELKNASVAHSHLNTAEKELSELESKAAKWDDPHTQDALELQKALDWANEVHLTDLNYKAILKAYRSSKTNL